VEISGFVTESDLGIANCRLQICKPLVHQA
jgi:hypothetical protein